MNAMALTEEIQSCLVVGRLQTMNVRLSARRAPVWCVCARTPQNVSQSQPAMALSYGKRRLA